jgi:hypothetical protein
MYGMEEKMQRCENKLKGRKEIRKEGRKYDKNNGYEKINYEKKR